MPWVGFTLFLQPSSHSIDCFYNKPRRNRKQNARVVLHFQATKKKFPQPKYCNFNFCWHEFRALSQRTWHSNKQTKNRPAENSFTCNTPLCNFSDDYEESSDAFIKKVFLGCFMAFIYKELEISFSFLLSIFWCVVAHANNLLKGDFDEVVNNLWGSYNSGRFVLGS